MYAHKSQGGLGAPDFEKYYLAQHLQTLASWVLFRSFNRWMEIEKLWAVPHTPMHGSGALQ